MAQCPVCTTQMIGDAYHEICQSCGHYAASTASLTPADFETGDHPTAEPKPRMAGHQLPPPRPFIARLAAKGV